MQITVLGGTGYAGSHIVAEAVARGHQVTSWSRNRPVQSVEGVRYESGSVLDLEVLKKAVGAAEVVVVSLSPRGELAGRVREVVVAAGKLAQDTGSRLAVVGGAGSLFVAEGGPKVHETEAFPAEFKAEATEMGEVLADLRAWDGPLDWFFVSPAGGFGPWVPGERTGQFRLGGDVLLTDAEGNSNLSGPDLAVAIVDEIEAPQHRRQRFTAAY